MQGIHCPVPSTQPLRRVAVCRCLLIRPNGMSPCRSRKPCPPPKPRRHNGVISSVTSDDEKLQLQTACTDSHATHSHLRNSCTIAISFCNHRAHRTSANSFSSDAQPSAETTEGCIKRRHWQTPEAAQCCEFCEPRQAHEFTLVCIEIRLSVRRRPKRRSSGGKQLKCRQMRP